MWALLRATVTDWRNDHASRLAAALAFYATVSVAPLLVVVLAVAGSLFGAEAVRGHLAAELAGFVGPSTADFLQQVVQSASSHRSGVMASWLGGITLLLGASGVFGQLQEALNLIFDAPPPRGGWWNLVKTRFLSLLLVFGLGFLLMLSVLLSAVQSAFGGILGASGPLLHELISAALFALLFGMLYRALPDIRLSWRDVWVGALVTSFLFTVGKILFGLYLGYSAVGSSYGAAGALLVLLLWIYYSAQIVFFGAEFTQVYSRYRTSGEAAPSARTCRSSPAAAPAAPAGRSARSAARARPAPTG